MSNSDSDAFESADEDFEEQKAKIGFYFVYTLICMDKEFLSFLNYFRCSEINYKTC